MRVCPTHYTISAAYLKLWFVEVSLDGESWTEIHRRANKTGFDGERNPASYAVLKTGDCRYIRLTQTDTNTQDNQPLFLYAVDFFGTLSE
jgi:hypothetical protein